MDSKAAKMRGALRCHRNLDADLIALTCQQLAKHAVGVGEQDLIGVTVLAGTQVGLGRPEADRDCPVGLRIGQQRDATEARLLRHGQRQRVLKRADEIVQRAGLLSKRGDTREHELRSSIVHALGTLHDRLRYGAR